MSNKVDKKKRKEAKQQAGKRREQRNSLFIKFAIGIMIPIALFVFYQGLFTGSPVLAPGQVVDTDQTRGAENAALTVTVYADFQCPQCLQETEIIAGAWRQVSRDVHLVFRHFPLDTHRHAFLAARYAEAAGKQGNFWQMHDLLFANQLFWSGLSDAVSTFDGYAIELGLDLDQLQVDLDSAEVRSKIIADQQGGVRAGVRGTPVMFFNGRRVDNPRSVGEFVEMVNDAISG